MGFCHHESAACAVVCCSRAVPPVPAAVGAAAGLAPATACLEHVVAEALAAVKACAIESAFLVLAAEPAGCFQENSLHFQL